MHDSFYHFIVELNKYYLKMPAFYQGDYEQRGFQWLDCHQEANCIYAIQRTAYSGKEAKEVVCGIFNFSREEKNYPAPFLDDAKYDVLLNTDWERFSGRTKEIAESYQKGEMLLLPPYSGILFQKQEKDKEKKIQEIQESVKETEIEEVEAKEG